MLTGQDPHRRRQDQVLENSWPLLRPDMQAMFDNVWKEDCNIWRLYFFRSGHASITVFFAVIPTSFLMEQLIFKLPSFPITLTGDNLFKLFYGQTPRTRLLLTAPGTSS